MNSKEILKLHISKMINLSDEQFDYFFSHFEQQSCKKGNSLVPKHLIAAYLGVSRETLSRL